MFETMTVTKAGAAICGALLVFLLGNWAAGGLYSSGGGHGHGEVTQGFKIDTGASEEATASTEEGPSFAELYASADAAAGEKVYAKCRACHKLDGNDATGPHLNGVVDRAVASSAGFGYSDALKNKGGNWTPEALDHFLLNPKADAPGTKMSFAGLPKAQDRANLIAYLASNQ